jgi:hypothetical protein
MVKVVLPEQVCFFEHIGEGGDVECLAPARAYPNLLQVGRVKVGGNDRASGVVNRGSRW